EENCFVSSRAVAKVCIQPIDEAVAIMDSAGFDCPFEAMRITVRTGRECRREPALQSQKSRQRQTALLNGHGKRRVRAGRAPAASRDPLRGLAASPRSHGRAGCAETGFEFRSANAGCLDAMQGARADPDLYA